MNIYEISYKKGMKGRKCIKAKSVTIPVSATGCYEFWVKSDIVAYVPMSVVTSIVLKRKKPKDTSTQENA